MSLLVYVATLLDMDPPAGSLSPLAWVIILALCSAFGTSVAVAMKWISKLYDDLKSCNAARASESEDILAMLRVARTQMERSRGGKQP